MKFVTTFGYSALALALAACGSQQRDTPAATPMAAEPAAQAATPANYQLPPGAPPLPADLLAVGSQDARDDLYCSALIYDANPDVSDALAPVDEALLRKAQALGFIIGESGINKLVEQKAVHATHARAIGDAYTAQVEKDTKAGAPRLSLETCNARAAAVPKPE
jgi:hypothetical protein